MRGNMNYPTESGFIEGWGGEIVSVNGGIVGFDTTSLEGHG